MEILIKIAQFILSLSLLIIIHELGHFISARIFKVRVEKFYLFFDAWFSLLKFKKGDTEYGLGWIPFGGYVKISGMIDESMDTEQMKQPVQPYEFRAKPAWQRLLIMAGGVIMNLILAVCIYIGMTYVWGEEYISNDNVKYGYVFSETARDIGFEDGDKIIDFGGVPVDDRMHYAQIPLALALDQPGYVTVERGGAQQKIYMQEDMVAKILKSSDFLTLRYPFVANNVIKDGAAAEGGMQAGDTLVSFNGEPMRYFDQFQKALDGNKGQAVEIGVKRDSAGVSRLVNLNIRVSGDGLIGVELPPLDRMFSISTYKYTLWQAIPKGIERTGTQLSSYWKQIKLIFTPQTEAYKSVGGIFSIGNMFPGEWSWYAFWNITAFISIALAVFNILPIPALDGGHIVFLLYEVITRRKPSEKFVEYTQMVGLVLVFGLLIVITGNDIYKIFIK